MRVEPLGDAGKGVEFLLERNDGVTEAHQVKRQVGDANEWNFGALSRLGVWASAQRHAEADREFHFVSMVPFRTLQELSERARNSNDLASFILGSLPQSLSTLFTKLCEEYGGSTAAYRVLRQLRVRLIDEFELRKSNAVLADVLLQGGQGSQARAALGELVDDNIDAALTPERLLEAFRPYNLQRRLAGSRQGLAERVGAESAAWLVRVGHQLIQPVIIRSEADRLQNLTSASERVHFLVAPAGGGKTGILHQTITGLLANQIPVLVLRLDRFGSLTTTTDLGRQLDLDVSPVTALAAAASGETAVLVIDQLDAVSLASGRLPENFDVVVDLVTEAVAIPGIKVVLACRQFDVDNDHRIRGLRDRLEAAVVSVAPLSDEKVEAAVKSLGLPALVLTQPQRDILRLPLHLALFATIAHEPMAMNFTSSQRLFDAYWEHKRQAARRRREGVRFNQVISRVAEVISERQELSVPISVLDDADLADDAGVLVSEQILVRDGLKIAFFHEAVFDYAFARQWIHKGQSVVTFLTGREQELFLRGQVRQIMAHLRAVDPGRFVKEVQALMVDDRVRFHIKDAVLTVLGNLSAPTSCEAKVLLELAKASPQLDERLWSRLHALTWFDRFAADGYIDVWLNGDEKLQERALTLMVGVAGTIPDRLAELLATHTEAASYAEWLRRVARFADLGASRSLFDLLLDGIKQGLYDGLEPNLWLTVHHLPEQHPEWAMELLAAFLIERPVAFELNDRGQVAILKERDYQGAEFIRSVSKADPCKFSETFLPYLLRVMELTAYKHDDDALRSDAHFSFRYPHDSTPNSELDNLLFDGVSAGLRLMATTCPDDLRPTLIELAGNSHESAQWLLYQALLENGAAYAEWAGNLLLEGQHRLLCGYASNGVWTTRQVLQAIRDYVSDDLFGQIEAVVRDLAFPWERGRPGWYAFNLLSAWEEVRLSNLGRRRLGELRRALNAEQPSKPEGIRGGWIGPPISGDAARRMTDDNWMSAMIKHSDERENFTTFKGGAREQAQVLQQETKQNPKRFAQFALRLTADINPAYADAILIGLGEADAVSDEQAVFNALRHIASLGHSDNDRWLGSALRPYLKTTPLDLVQLITDRLVTTTDPNGDGICVWTEDEEGRRQPDIVTSGINTARGSLAGTMANLLTYDTDGARTALVAPFLSHLATDQSIPVRTSVARLIGTAMRHARLEATEAFWLLIQTDDALLGTQEVVRLIVFIGHRDPGTVQPLIMRMLASNDQSVREYGGQLAVLAAMEWGNPTYLLEVTNGQDAAARKGAAGMAAHRLPHAADTGVSLRTLVTLLNDDSEEVRREAAEVASVLRGLALQPFEGVIQALIASRAFDFAASQLILTLESAPDRVNALALLCAQRFVERLQVDAVDIRSGISGDARDVGQLIIRGLAQSQGARDRAALLDVLDQLLAAGAYGINSVITEAER
ncbi:UNVERIFIED_CONTAM: hypothetical protein Q9R71_31035 [Actinomycetes bacterium ARC8]|nr:hypothetical protein [Actinomycetes bacterium ARC8]